MAKFLLGDRDLSLGDRALFAPFVRSSAVAWAWRGALDAALLPHGVGAVAPESSAAVGA
jgi:hypothetical protein